MSVWIERTDRDFKDKNHFAFSFESHGRCKCPKKFARREETRNGNVVFLWENHPYGFIRFGSGGDFGCFSFGNKKSNSFCCDTSKEYEGLDDLTLSGKNGDFFGPYFHCRRLVVVQFN